VRHSRVAVSGLCYGQLDVPLAASFPAEAEALRADLQQRFGQHLPPIWSSPSQRCLQLAQTLHPQVRLEPRLLELSFGDWEGQRWEQLDGPAARHWGDNWQSARPPGGETLAELLARLQAFLAELSAPDALLVTHAGPIRCLQHLLGGVSLERAFGQPVPCASLLQLPWPDA